MTRRIYLASPYRGDVEANKLYARRCQADSLARGEAPFAPHLLYTQSLDDDLADERAVGMAAAMAWLPVCDALVLYTDRGVSDGMEVEAQQARRLGIPVEERACPGYARVEVVGRPDGGCEHYEQGRPRGSCTTANLSRETRRAWQEAGCTPTTFHGLRRSAGAHWIECGTAIYDVSRLLGHTDLATTVRWYADVADSGLVRAIDGVEDARVRVAEDTDGVQLGAQVYHLPRKRAAGTLR